MAGLNDSSDEDSDSSSDYDEEDQAWVESTMKQQQSKTSKYDNEDDDDDDASSSYEEEEGNMTREQQGDEDFHSENEEEDGDGNENMFGDDAFGGSYADDDFDGHSAASKDKPTTGSSPWQTNNGDADFGNSFANTKMGGGGGYGDSNASFLSPDDEESSSQNEEYASSEDNDSDYEDNEEGKPNDSNTFESSQNLAEEAFDSGADFDFGNGGETNAIEDESPNEESSNSEGDDEDYESEGTDEKEAPNNGFSDNAFDDSFGGDSNLFDGEESSDKQAGDSASFNASGFDGDHDGKQQQEEEEVNEEESENYVEDGSEDGDPGSYFSDGNESAQKEEAQEEYEGESNGSQQSEDESDNSSQHQSAEAPTTELTPPSSPEAPPTQLTPPSNHESPERDDDDDEYDSEEDDMGNMEDVEDTVEPSQKQRQQTLNLYSMNPSGGDGYHDDEDTTIDGSMFDGNGSNFNLDASSGNLDKDVNEATVFMETLPSMGNDTRDVVDEEDQEEHFEKEQGAQNQKDYDFGFSQHDREDSHSGEDDYQEGDQDAVPSVEMESPRSKKGYNREQIKKVAKSSSSRRKKDGEASVQSSRKSGKSKKHKKKSSDRSMTSDSKSHKSDKKKKSKKKRKQKIKSEALLDLVAHVNEAMQVMEEYEADEDGPESDCRNLMNGFEALVGILLQLSDELELMSTFARAKDQSAIEALKSLLSFAPVLDETFIQLSPVLRHYLTAEVDEELSDLFYGMNLMVDLLCELCHKVGERQDWNPRACTAFTTLLELLARDSLEVVSIYDDVDTPKFEASKDLAEAWNATGHSDEFNTLSETQDLAIFRQISYEVILSCDQWCPDVDTLMDICGIDDSMLEEGTSMPYPLNEADLVPVPEAAVQVLEKVNGLPVPRIKTLAHILRRVLPGNKITDRRLIDSLVSIKNNMRSAGAPAANMVAISSVPESGSSPNSLGVAGVGKATLAALVANHPDVRSHFDDGIAWIHIGQKELNYTRYVQCLKDVLAQLDIQDTEEPLFPELLQTPGEPVSRSRRREEGFMMFVRESVADFLQDRKVLIILDDVCFDSDLDWFDFGAPPEEADEPGACCFVLLTTRRRDLLPPADTVEVDVMEESEAVQLLIRESGELSRNLSESAETRAVVRECANHPLAVKSVGRWLNLKHATAGSSENSKEEIHEDVVSSMEKILRSGASGEADMMYEILNMSLSPAINGEPTTIIKFCFSAFVRVFCDKEFISDFALADASPIVPLVTAEVLFEALIDLEEDNLRKDGSLFDAKKKDAAVLIPEALSALGVLKVIETMPEEEDGEDAVVEKYLQVTHVVQQEYGEYLLEDDISLKDFTVGAERRWNRAFAEMFLNGSVEWDSETPDSGLDYALEMMPVHMIRGGMYSDAAKLLANENFSRGRLFALGRENGARRHIKDCETLFDILQKQKSSSRKKLDPKSMMKQSYKVLGSLLNMDEDEFIKEEGSPEAVEVGRCHFEIGFSLAEKRCWEAAISHWETSQELFVSSLGMVEVVAGVLFNVGVVYSQMTEYEQALGALKQCLRIRGAIHGEEHILYAQTIQKIGDVFLAMSDYHEALESYNWALDVMHIEPSHHRIDIGDILENMGNIHYSKGEIGDSLQCFQDALRSKVADLGQDNPELASIYQNIGNCLSDQGKTDDAVVHFKESIRLKELDPHGGFERDADILTINGVLFNLDGKQQQGLECYEKALQILVTKVSHRKEKVASLLHLIGCVYLVGGEHKKAMKLFEESLQARRKVLGFVHLDVASTLFNMAFLHQTRNRLDKALKCLEEALKIRQLRLPDSEKVALTHEKIGTLARSIGKAKKAEIAFTEALRIRKLIHGDGHVAVATVLQELGDLFDDLGDYNEASKYYRDALKIRHNRLGPEDLAVAETFYSMGYTLMNQGALDKALECLEESLSIRKFKLGEDAKECGDTLNTMGFIQAKRNDLEDALQLLWDALRIRKLKGDKIKMSETLKNIGNVHREKQEYELAKECYEECLRVRREHLGESEDDRVADALIAIGNVYSDMDKPSKAMSSYKEALAIRSRLFGDSDESVAAVLQYMGTLEFKAKRLDRALQLLNEFIHIREGNETEPDGDHVNVLFMIGNIHKMQGNEQEAQSCWTEAYRIFKELGLAESNPEIAQVMDKMMRDNGGVAGAAAQEQYQKDSMEQPLSSPGNKKKGVLNRLKKKVKGSTSGGKREKNKGQRL